MKDKVYEIKDYGTKSGPNKFMIHVKCSNCRDHFPVHVTKGTKVKDRALSMLKCVKCGIVGMLRHVEHDGKHYVEFKRKKGL